MFPSITVHRKNLSEGYDLMIIRTSAINAITISTVSKENTYIWVDGHEEPFVVREDIDTVYKLINKSIKFSPREVK